LGAACKTPGAANWYAFAAPSNVMITQQYDDWQHTQSKWVLDYTWPLCQCLKGQAQKPNATNPAGGSQLSK